MSEMRHIQTSNKQKPRRIGRGYRLAESPLSARSETVGYAATAVGHCTCVMISAQSEFTLACPVRATRLRGGLAPDNVMSRSPPMKTPPEPTNQMAWVPLGPRTALICAVMSPDKWI